MNFLKTPEVLQKHQIRKYVKIRKGWYYERFNSMG